LRDSLLAGELVFCVNWHAEEVFFGDVIMESLEEIAGLVAVASIPGLVVVNVMVLLAAAAWFFPAGALGFFAGAFFTVIEVALGTLVVLVVEGFFVRACFDEGFPASFFSTSLRFRPRLAGFGRTSPTIVGASIDSFTIALSVHVAAR